MADLAKQERRVPDKTDPGKAEGSGCGPLQGEKCGSSRTTTELVHSASAPLSEGFVTNQMPLRPAQNISGASLRDGQQ